MNLTRIEIAMRNVARSKDEVRKLLRDTEVPLRVYFDSQTVSIYVNNDRLAKLLPSLIESGMMV